MLAQVQSQTELHKSGVRNCGSGHMHFSQPYGQSKVTFRAGSAHAGGQIILQRCLYLIDYIENLGHV